MFANDVIGVFTGIGRIGTEHDSNSIVLTCIVRRDILVYCNNTQQSYAHCK